MSALVNQQHEAFCQAYARGGTQAAAYLTAYPASSLRAARVSAPRLLARADVVARIEEIRRDLPPEVQADSTPQPPDTSNEAQDTSKPTEVASNIGDDTSSHVTDVEVPDNPAQSEDPLTSGATAGEPTPVAPVLDAEVVEAPAPGTALLTPQERREIYTRWGRAKRLVSLHDKLSTLLWERGQHPDMADVPGGRTGLVLVRYKTIRHGDDYRMVKEYSTDTGLVAELRALLQQTAAELGQWYEHRVLTETETAPVLAAGTPDLRGLSLEELETLRQLYSKAATTAAARLAPPA